MTKKALPKSTVAVLSFFNEGEIKKNSKFTVDFI